MLLVTITTAHKLSTAHFTKIKNAVEKKYGKDVNFNLVTDENVVGGIRVLVGSKEIDATVEGRLEQIKKQLETEK